jgi:hypothetical protein
MNVSAFIMVGIVGIAIGFGLGMWYSALRFSGESKTGASAQIESRLAPPPAKPTLVKTTSPGEDAPTPAASPAPEATDDSLSSALPVQKPQISPMSVLARALQADVRNPQPAEKSIAVQIDEILQENLENSPLASRAIRLLELPNKGMVVMVGLDQYAGVDAVPDEEIKTVIRTAVAEWERRVSE